MTHCLASMPVTSCSIAHFLRHMNILTATEHFSVDDDHKWCRVHSLNKIPFLWRKSFHSSRTSHLMWPLHSLSQQFRITIIYFWPVLLSRSSHMRLSPALYASNNLRCVVLSSLLLSWHDLAVEKRLLLNVS